MIAASGMTQSVRVATRSVADFEKFVPCGLKMLSVETVT